MPSLSEIRVSPPAPRPERTYLLCLDGAIPARLCVLAERERAILAEDQRAPEDGRPRKLAQGASPELTQIREEMADLEPQLEASSGLLTVAALQDNGAWQAFSDANPARAEGEPGHDRDKRFTGLTVNVDAVVAQLHLYVKAWDGEPVGPGDWDRISSSAALGDLREIAGIVAEIYEEPQDFPKWRAVLSGVLAR